MFAHELGFKVSIVDSRPIQVNQERFNLADEVLEVRPENGEWRSVITDRCQAVIMTHNNLTDLQWLANLLPLQLPYLGLMGPRKRAEKMLAEISQNGQCGSDEDLSAVHNPIGLDIGAETPEQIALAIVAEIQATLKGRNGAPLRQKNGPVRFQETDGSCLTLCPTTRLQPSSPLVSV